MRVDSRWTRDYKIDDSERIVLFGCVRILHQFLPPTGNETGQRDRQPSHEYFGRRRRRGRAELSDRGSSSSERRSFESHAAVAAEETHEEPIEV